METFKRTPLQLFNLPQHFVIPLFQRPYVWKEEEQWEPLWKDIQRVAELRIHEPHLNPQHFLGAIVLQAHVAGSNRVTTWNVIDGQQRLTTLQLLMDATAAVMTQAGSDRYASQLAALTHNAANYLPHGESLLKVRHRNNHHGAFDEVMGAEPPIDYSDLRHRDSRIVTAHRYFTTTVTRWLGAPDSGEFEIKAAHLANVLQSDLQLVTIELLAAENSQEIFETLNARGTPLTAADLVRNFVFQRLEAEGGDTKRAYREDWPFETRFWTKEVSVGRYLVSRSSLFLNQWLIARTGEEVSPQSTFTRFKSYVEHSGHKMADLLPLIKAQAAQYEGWTEAATRPGGDLTPVQMAFYRMGASGIELLKPLILWLHEPGRNLPQRTINRITAAAESWVVRRQLLRLSNSDLGRIVAELIKTNYGAQQSDLEERVISQLSRLNATSNYWPGDDEIKRTMKLENTYLRYPGARLRSFLEAIENHYREETQQPQVARTGLPIEHILPQKWQENWPVGSLDSEQDRQTRVHRLGNLTLLTTGLNSKVSNGPWPKKRAELLKHNTIEITGHLIGLTEHQDWDETLIDARTEALIDVLLRVWPVPVGHKGEVVDPQTKAQEWVEIKHLVEGGLLQPGDRLVAVPAAFAGSEAIVGDDFRIHVDGKSFDTPSGAGKHLRLKATNGWYFWGLADGRRLRDLRTEFLSQAPNDQSLIEDSDD